jgi:1-deoxy-D-xylulose-5-phosphate reductoisomerase
LSFEYFSVAHSLVQKCVKNASFQKKITILGSTGSIGISTLKVAQNLFPEVQVKALAAKSNIDLLEKQALEFKPELVAVYDKDKALKLRQRLSHTKTKVIGGIEGLQEVAGYEGVNCVVSAMSGTIGIMPTICAIEKGKQIALANKEVLVSAGEYVTALAAKRGVPIIPIDSEHSALFQCLHGQKKSAVRRLILTASGGPFRNLDPADLEKISVQQALAHPTWQMGSKVTIDCSTLMNKGLEVIEAHYLFGIPVDQIEVVIHPQSVIHSLVEFVDGSMLAQMSEPNMIIPIQYALTHPERREGLLEPFDFQKVRSLDFFPPDMEKFKCLKLSLEAIRHGQSYPCYLNAANEVLVNRFLEGKISWKEISSKLEKLLSSHRSEKLTSLDKIIEIDQQARREATLS